MDVSIQKYFAFVKTVESGSFTKAAEILNYSQSGISRMIGDLEREWQVTLLERGRGGVRLTSEGIRLLPFAQNVCREYENLQSEIGEINGFRSGLIRIGTFSSVATHRLPGIIKRFQKEYPEIDYEILLGDYSEIETWILEGRIDCGLLRLPAAENLETVFLEQDRMLVVLPEDHPLAALDKIPLGALNDETFMLLEKGSKAEVSEILERSGVRPKIHFTTWDDYAIMAMVESGLGISILPELILKRTPYKIAARELEIPAYRNIGLAWKEKKGGSQVLNRFKEYVEFS